MSDRATRLFEAVRDDVVEVVEHGFPRSADIVPRDRRAIAGRFARSPGRDDKEQWRNFYRTVDQALTDASSDDPLPIVLAGVNSSTGLSLKSVATITSSPAVSTARMTGPVPISSARRRGR